MTQLHEILGVLAIAVNGLAGAVGAITLWRRVHPRRGYAHLVAAGQTVLIGQAAVGLLLLSEGKRSPDRLHYLYGAVALAAVLSPWIYAPPEPRARLIWFTGAGLLAAALSIRGYLTGS
jgi:hypothetical protein